MDPVRRKKLKKNEKNHKNVREITPMFAVVNSVGQPNQERF